MRAGERERERKRERHTHRYTDTHTDTHTHIQTADSKNVNGFLDGAGLCDVVLIDMGRMGLFATDNRK